MSAPRRVELLGAEVAAHHASAGDDKTRACVEIVKQLSDAVELVNDAVERLRATCLNDPSSLNAEERAVCFAWLATHIINNGGFDYLFESYFEGDADYKKTAAAFHQIGATRAASAFDEAMSCFPDATPHADLDQRLSAYGSVPESSDAAWTRHSWTRTRRSFCLSLDTSNKRPASAGFAESPLSNIAQIKLGV
jgi:hypothetical protein